MLIEWWVLAIVAVCALGIGYIIGYYRAKSEYEDALRQFLDDPNSEFWNSP